MCLNVSLEVIDCHISQTQEMCTYKSQQWQLLSPKICLTKLEVHRKKKKKKEKNKEKRAFNQTKVHAKKGKINKHIPR